MRFGPRVPINVAQTAANGFGSLFSAALNRDQIAAEQEARLAPGLAQAAALASSTRLKEQEAEQKAADAERARTEQAAMPGRLAEVARLNAGIPHDAASQVDTYLKSGAWGSFADPSLAGPPEDGQTAVMRNASAPQGVTGDSLSMYRAALAALQGAQIGGGKDTTENISSAMLKNLQGMRSGAIISGQLDPQAVARAEMAIKGTSPYAFNEYGVGNAYTGAVDASGPVAQRFGQYRGAQTGAATANATQSLAAAGASRAQGDKSRAETDLLKLEMPGAPGAVSTAGGRATLPGLGKAPTGYLWGERDAATGTPTLIPVKGGPADKGPANATEDERKAAGWVAQAQFAFDNVQKVLDKTPNANRPVPLAEAAGMLPGKLGRAAQNSLTPEARQQFEQASNSFAEAALRAATGAGVNRDEAQQKVAELTPQIGDRPETIRQKKEAWGVYLESLRLRAGRALPPSLADAARDSVAPPSATPGAPGRNVRVTY